LRGGDANDPKDEDLRWARLLFGILTVLSLEARSAAAAQGQTTIFTSDDVIRALDAYELGGGAYPTMVRRIVYCECSNRAGPSAVYDPMARVSVGRGLELLGCGQLLSGPGNGLAIFTSWGYSDWRDPWQVVSWIDEVIRRGYLDSQYPNTQRGCARSP